MADRRPPGEIVASDLGQGRWLITVSGEHDLTTAATLRAELETAIGAGSAVVVDLGGTTFLDSSILAVLVHADELAQQTLSRPLGLVVTADGAADRLFVVTGARRAFTIFASVEDALTDAALVHGTDAEATSGRWATRRQRIVKNEQAFR